MVSACWHLPVVRVCSNLDDKEAWQWCGCRTSQIGGRQHLKEAHLRAGGAFVQRECPESLLPSYKSLSEACLSAQNSRGASKIPASDAKVKGLHLIADVSVQRKQCVVMRQAAPRVAAHHNVTFVYHVMWWVAHTCMMLILHDVPMCTTNATVHNMLQTHHMILMR